MTQPLGYYIDTTIPVVGDIEREYGSNLEKMSVPHKAYLIADLATSLSYKFNSQPTAQYAPLALRIGLEVKQEKDAIALLKAFVNSL
ncbi:hypothetical protein [Calothrix rhizosoleniae]|uniref:hypothetical protein n=1 Tax=Calothrix rhizosoleniae TaxID=888997 RepID=UPI000B4A0154|nr:hypothetical protein [Calothrix rhizosoleniae]